MPYKNKENQSKYRRRYYLNNQEKERKHYIIHREEIKNYNRLYYLNVYKKIYESNKDKINSDKRKLHAENPEILKKQYKRSKKAICIICGKPARQKYCSKKCMGVGMEESNNRFWNGGSKDGYPMTWTKRFKRSIRKRDSYICMKCGKPHEKYNPSLDVHHIDGIKKNTFENNCISLCKKCHSFVETRPIEVKEKQIIEFYELLSKLYGYKYIITKLV